MLNNKTPRQYSLVKIKESAHSDTKEYFKECSTIIFLGEIPNMPGHCIVYRKRFFLDPSESFSLGDEDKIEYGFHTDDFEEISIEEI